MTSDEGITCDGNFSGTLEIIGEEDKNKGDIIEEDFGKVE